MACCLSARNGLSGVSLINWGGIPGVGWGPRFSWEWQDTWTLSSCFPGSHDLYFFLDFLFLSLCKTGLVCQRSQMHIFTLRKGHGTIEGVDNNGREAGRPPVWVLRSPVQSPWKERLPETSRGLLLCSQWLRRPEGPPWVTPTLGAPGQQTSAVFSVAWNTHACTHTPHTQVRTHRVCFSKTGGKSKSVTAAKWEKERN